MRDTSLPCASSLRTCWDMLAHLVRGNCTAWLRCRGGITGLDASCRATYCAYCLASCSRGCAGSYSMLTCQMLTCLHARCKLSVNSMLSCMAGCRHTPGNFATPYHGTNGRNSSYRLLSSVSCQAMQHQQPIRTCGCQRPPASCALALCGCRQECRDSTVLQLGC